MKAAGNRTSIIFIPKTRAKNIEIWIMKIIYVNCGVKKLLEGRSSQLYYTTYAVAKKKAWKKNSVFFQGSFQNCISCVYMYNCDDLPLNNFLTPQFTYMIIIYS